MGPTPSTPVSRYFIRGSLFRVLHTGIRQSIKPDAQLVAATRDWFAPAHVLDANQLAKTHPQRGVVNRVRVYDDGSAASGDFLQPLDDVSLVPRIDPGRRMDRDIREAPEIQTIERFHQGIKLCSS